MLNYAESHEFNPRYKTEWIFPEFDFDMKNHLHMCVVGETGSGKTYWLKQYLIENSIPKIKINSTKHAKINSIYVITPEHNVKFYTDPFDPPVKAKYFNHYKDRLNLLVVNSTNEIIDTLTMLDENFKSNIPDTGLRVVVLDDSINSEKFTSKDIVYKCLFSIRHLKVKVIFVIQYARKLLSPAIRNNFSEWYLGKNGDKYMLKTSTDLIEMNLPTAIPKGKRHNMAVKLIEEAIDNKKYGFIHIDRYNKMITTSCELKINL